MADYKFRVTVDLELATSESASRVRDWLKAEFERALLVLANDRIVETRTPSDVFDDVLTFEVRAKRLDDTALIGPPISIRLPTLTCPSCGRTWTDVVVERVPITCRHCHRAIRIEGTVRP